VAEAATIGSFDVGIRTTILKKGLLKLAMEIFAVCVIPSVNGA
jgi:hypothetical protein